MATVKITYVCELVNDKYCDMLNPIGGTGEQCSFIHEVAEDRRGAASGGACALFDELLFTERSENMLYATKRLPEVPALW